MSAVSRNMAASASVAGIVACLALIFLLPSAAPTRSHAGPEWRNSLRHAHHNMAKAVSAFAQNNEGSFLRSLAELIPHEFYPIRDPVLGWQETQWRSYWYLVKLLGVASVVLLVVAVAWRRYRWVIAVAATGGSVATLCVGIWVQGKTRVPQSSYDYIDRYTILSDLNEPVPADVPILWTSDPYPITRCEGGFAASDGWCDTREYSPFDLEGLKDDLSAAGRDVEGMLSRARDGLQKRPTPAYLNALLVLAVRREPAAGDLFAAIDDGGAERRVALWGLYMLGDERAAKKAVQALSSEDPAVRAYAARLLGRLRPEGVSKMLVPLLKSYKTRGAALESIGVDGDSSVAEEVLRLLDDRRISNEAKLAVWKALVRMGDERGIDLLLEEIERLKKSRDKRLLYVSLREPLMALAEAGDSSVPILVSLVEDGTSYYLKTLIEAFAATRSQAAIEPLLKLVSREPETVGVALSKLGPRGERILLRFANSNDTRERWCAAAGLGHSKHQEAVPLLISMLKDKSITGIYAARSLGQQRDRRAVDPLMEQLKNPNDHMRSAAHHSLVQIGDFRAVPALKEAAARERDPHTAASMRSGARRLEAYKDYLEARRIAESADANPVRTP